MSYRPYATLQGKRKPLHDHRPRTGHDVRLIGGVVSCQPERLSPSARERRVLDVHAWKTARAFDGRPRLIGR